MPHGEPRLSSRECASLIQKHEYLIMVEWSALDGEFVTRVDQLPGVTACGPTLLEAVAELEDAILAYHSSMDADEDDQ